MALFLNDAEVTSLLSTVECVDILDDLFMQEVCAPLQRGRSRRLRSRSAGSVSYTHLDVYKRQIPARNVVDAVAGQDDLAPK